MRALNYAQIRAEAWRLLQMAWRNPAGFIAYIFGQRWVRFGIVGVAATLAYFALGLLFVYIMDLPVLVGNTLAYALSFAISYIGQSRWTFQAHGSHARMLPRFAATQLFGLGLNSLMVEGLISLGLPYAIDMFIAAATVPVAVYLICKIWVFRQETAGVETKK